MKKHAEEKPAEKPVEKPAKKHGPDTEDMSLQRSKDSGCVHCGKQIAVGQTYLCAEHVRRD